jgi:hypothetical protein
VPWANAAPETANTVAVVMSSFFILFLVMFLVGFC